MEGSMANSTYARAYRFDACKECGECLHGCVNNNLSPQEAVDGIKRLRNDDDVDDILDSCVSCGNCAHRCKELANPYALILQRLYKRRERDGQYSSSMKYFMNGMLDKGRKHTFFLDIENSQTKQEKDIRQLWSEPKKCNDLLLCSCGIRMQPLNIEHSEVLRDLSKFGGSNECCGIRQFKNGLWDESFHAAENLMERLSQCSFTRLVVPCGACQDMIQSKIPRYFEYTLPFTVISIYDYFLERLSQGKISIMRPVNMEASLSDACWIEHMGGTYIRSIEKLCSMISLITERLPHSGEQNLCCGAAHLYRYGSLGDSKYGLEKKERDIVECGRDTVLTNCQGCAVSLRNGRGYRVKYLLEKLLWSMGDDIPDH